jgi:ubiquinone/menaquinone biosynthesis C-methylase UbiE
MTFGQRFARVATSTVVRVPWLWWLFRGRLERGFDRLAPEWDTTRASPTRLDAIRAALDAVVEPPRTALDVGTGTGSVARDVAERWPDADVTGVDFSEGMIAEAARLTQSGLVHYDVADASALPFPDGVFDLVTLNNMIPFFAELARVTAPGGSVAIAYSRGSQTPIWVPLDRVRRELESREFTHFADFSVGPGVSLLARKREQA